MAKILPKSAVLLTFVLTTSGLLNHAKKFAKNDEIFNAFLLKASKNYTNWLKENSLDPSQPISQTLHMESYDFALTFLKCDLRNQQVSGHSSSKIQSFDPDTSFELKYIGISRQQNDTNKFTGSFSCTVKAITVGPDVYFSGQGTYHISTNRSAEVAAYTNIGITEDYKLNLTLAYLEPLYVPDFNQGELRATWNDSTISNDLLEKIETEFIEVYRRNLMFSRLYGTGHLNPMQPMLSGYLKSIIENLDLTTVLAEDFLPDPYKPTPSPAPTTTTAATTKEANTSPETTPEPTTTEKNGATIHSKLTLLLALPFITALRLK